MLNDERRRYAIAGATMLVAGLALAWLLRPAAPGSSHPGVTVFAAASMRDVMHEVGSAFTIDHAPEVRVHFNIAGSNVLAQQIIAASQADLFVSANEKWMNDVEKAGRMIPGTRKPLLSNRLVVVANRGTDWEIETPGDLAALPFEHLSVGNPEAVPAGLYAKAFLSGIEHGEGTLWDAVAARVAPAADVRAALALVEVDPSVVGIVYRTDARASDDVRILFEVPDGAVPPVTYSAARIYRPDAPAAAAVFFEYLFTDDAQAVFAEHGFVPLRQEKRSP